MDANAFARLVDGDEAVLDQAYLEWSSYVTSWLVHKEKAPTADAEDLFADALLRFREKVRDGSIESFDNPRAYVLKTAIRMWHARCKQQVSLTRRHQMYYAKHFEDDYVDPLIAQEESFALAEEGKTQASAMQRALNKLDEICRNLLMDTLVMGLKPRDVFEKYGYKNARVLTDKKARCKKELVTLAHGFL
jgi:DNA-directed RNA polymerase specialized sigma24 family protein